MLRFEKCNSSSGFDCLPEEEIENWILNKYFVTAENTWVFKQENYDRTKLTAEVAVQYIPLSWQLNQEIYKKFTVITSEFQD